MFKNGFILFIIFVFCIFSGNELYAADKIKIVTSTLMFGDLARQIGGEKVEVKHVASPKFNVHFIQPKPSDVRNVAKADLFVFNGLDLEAWVDPLLEAAGKPELFRGARRNVDLSKGVPLLNVPTESLSRAMGDQHLFGNPHYTMSPDNLKISAQTLSEKLQEIDPENAAYYQSQTENFLARLNAKIAEWKAWGAECKDREVISYHDDFAYIAHFFGIKSEQFVEPKPGIPPTAKHLEFLEKYIREKKIRAIVMPTYYPKAAAETLARHVGVKVITVCHNVGEVPGTEDILSFYEYNFKQLHSYC